MNNFGEVLAYHFVCIVAQSPAAGVAHLPKLAGAVTGLVVHPVVGKIVEAAGDVAASQFRKLFGDVSER